MKVLKETFDRILTTCIRFLHFLFLLQAPASAHGKCPQFMALSGVSQYGNITSPGWPSPYPPAAICSYKLQGEAWQGVKITFHYFDLEPPYSAGCLNDYLELNTVDIKGQRTFRGRYCGRVPPAPILVLHPIVELLFRSNHAAHHDGFSASYEFVDESNVPAPRLNGTYPCGKVVEGNGGLIISPGFPRGYAAGLDCVWIQNLEFQGSTANCQKAQLRIYDGYEPLERHAVLKKYCGDTRFYKAEDDKYILSERNRLLVRFTTTEPSKPINDTRTNVGFQLVWSDVEFMGYDNCTKSSRFACHETQVCLSSQSKASSHCPDLKHYCISSELVCDGNSNCGEFDSSDERNCSKTPLVITVVATPLAILTSCLFLCFLCYRRNTRRGRRGTRDAEDNEQKNGTSCCGSSLCCCLRKKRQKNIDSSSLEEKCRPGNFGVDSAPITRGPIYFKNELESPGASDIVSPASGFSDSESEIGAQAPIYCPAHGPVHFVPLRYISRPFPLLPVLQEGSTYPSDLYEEGGSLYSTSQNSDMIIYEDKGGLENPILSNQTQPNPQQVPQQQLNGGIMNYNKPATPHPLTSTLGFVQEWRMKQLRRVQRSDAIYMSDDKNSSSASSPGRICPRCLEKEREVGMMEKQNISGAQFDSGIEIVNNSIMGCGEPVKNVSFETCTSSDSAISQGHCYNNQYRLTKCLGWKDKFGQPPMVEEITQTDPNPINESGGDVFCETVTTFGVKCKTGGAAGGMNSKATDV